MSNRWPGGIIRKTPVTPTGPLQNGSAPGMWSLADAAYWSKQGLWPIAGNEFVIEAYFSTYIYTGNGSTQTITNGIDVAGQGGLVWVKKRSAAESHFLVHRDGYRLESDTTGAEGSQSLLTLSSSGFNLLAGNSAVNASASTYVSWTFRKKPKFFDVVTYTGTGSAQTIAHNLGVAPGCMIVKRTNTASDWQVYHQSTAAGMGPSKYMVLNSTAAEATGNDRWNNTAPTASVFSVGTAPETNASGSTYVAYLFAHDTSSTGIIQCGSFTTSGVGLASVTLGWEPQAILIKRTDSSTEGSWRLLDNMRELNAVAGSADALFPNSSAAEGGFQGSVTINATGFDFSYGGNTSASYIYIAIRRGPMRTPTVGTSVFSPNLLASTPADLTTGFPVDLSIARYDRNTSGYNLVTDRMRGVSSTSSTTMRWLATSEAAAENNSALNQNLFSNTGFSVTGANNNGPFWSFGRAPGFFDVVCYTGTGVATTFNHNLGAVPELMIVKPRGSTGSWRVYAAPLTATKYLTLNQISAAGDDSTFGYAWNKTAPTSTVFSLGTGDTNISGVTHVNYLFASCPGVSKVGSYTGTGTTQTIDCGFTTGARFVMIKRTDSTGDWYVWNSATGIVAGNDPYLLMNSQAAQVTNTDYVDTDNSGFQISSTAPAAINASGGTFIYLAIS